MRNLLNYVTESLKYPKSFKLSDKVILKVNDNWDRNKLNDLVEKAKDTGKEQSHNDFVDDNKKVYVIVYDKKTDTFDINNESISNKDLTNFIKQLYL